MKKIALIFAVALVGVGSALTYHLFENAIHGAINYIWYDTFNTDENRWLVPLLAGVFALVFFGLQHYLDRKSETSEEHGLGAMPAPSIPHYLKVLLIGFFSLLAGATLGPEAILVPACMMIGAYTGNKLFADNKQVGQLLAAAGFIALFTAFFDSFIVGILSLYLVLSQSKAKFKPILLVVAIIAAGASQLTLNLVEGEPYVGLPSYGWNLNVETIIFGVLLVIAGFMTVQVMSYLSGQLTVIKNIVIKKGWVLRAIIASLVLSGLYIVGGPLVEFTGNKSIEPMFDQAPILGIGGLLLIFVIKLALIVWSKIIGYRGGMIFPTIFLASVMAAMIQQYYPDFNLVYGIIAVIVGALAANRKSRILA